MARVNDLLTFNTGMVNPVITYKGFYHTPSNAASIQSKLRLQKNDFTERVKTSLIKDSQTYRPYLIEQYLASNNTNSDYYVHDEFNLNGKSTNDPNYKEFEDPFKINYDALVGMKNFRFVYGKKMRNLLEFGQVDASDAHPIPLVTNQTAAMSMFNPLYMVNVRGIASNVPLLNKQSYMGGNENNISDCSIRELVSLSHKDNSILGQARYRYADFMFCKDLGKVSNNHLITLRVFPFPVGDHIFELSSPKYHAKKYSYAQTGDVGRLVTWFGTEENKLEDILTYDYNATWRPLEAKIEEIDTIQRENSEARGPLGMLINTFSKDYNMKAGEGIPSNLSLWQHIGGDAPHWDNREVLTNYDKNKVYEPKDTVQNTHLYEGKLVFNHEFTLTFSYKLRAYDNINPKSAFLDLLGNILAVTYRRGTFWGGSRKFIGPQHNQNAWNKANNLIDKNFDAVGGIFKGLLSNGFAFASLLGCISQFADLGKQLIKDAKNFVNNATNGALEGEGNVGQKAGNALLELDKNFHFSDALKGSLKNKMGRPALYAMQSLLEGDNVGLWHVTIGNPKNPIASIGNLIITKASIKHSGALGVDDFPSEIKVTVTLKHARGRDAVEIGNMYTKGLNGIYMLPKIDRLSDFYEFGSEEANIKAQESKAIEEQKKEYEATKQSATINTKEEKINEQQVKSQNKTDVTPEAQSPNYVDEEVQRLTAIGENEDIYNGNKNILISGSAVKYEWHGQTMMNMAKRVLDEIR